MLYTKDGYPDINEIVLCTVRKIYGNTTFVYLNEYEKEAVLTISEIAPGRIRNLRDHVIENKTIICKVLRVDAKQRRIDVSLRRVPIPTMKKKLETLKKEDFAEKVYTDFAKEINSTKDDIFEKTYEPIFENYETVFEALYEIMLDNTKVNMFKKLSDDEKKILIELINSKIKPENVTLKRKFHLTSMDSCGIDKITSCISKCIGPLKYDNLNVIYLAAGEFEITITHDDTKSAAVLINNFTKNLEIFAKSDKLTLKIE